MQQDKLSEEQAQKITVELADLDWEDRERILRLLFSKMNTGQSAADWRERQETSSQNRGGSSHLATAQMNQSFREQEDEEARGRHPRPEVRARFVDASDVRRERLVPLLLRRAAFEPGVAVADSLRHRAQRRPLVEIRVVGDGPAPLDELLHNPLTVGVFLCFAGGGPQYPVHDEAEDKLQGEVRQEQEQQDDGLRPGFLVGNQRDRPARGLERDDPMLLAHSDRMITQVLHQQAALLLEFHRFDVDGRATAPVWRTVSEVIVDVNGRATAPVRRTYNNWRGSHASGSRVSQVVEFLAHGLELRAHGVKVAICHCDRRGVVCCCISSLSLSLATYALHPLLRASGRTLSSY